MAGKKQGKSTIGDRMSSSGGIVVKKAPNSPKKAPKKGKK